MKHVYIELNHENQHFQPQKKFEVSMVQIDKIPRKSEKKM